MFEVLSAGENAEPVGREGHAIDPAPVTLGGPYFPRIFVLQAVQLLDLDLAELDYSLGAELLQCDVSGGKLHLRSLRGVVSARFPVHEDAERVSVGDHLEREPLSVGYLGEFGNEQFFPFGHEEPPGVVPTESVSAR